MRMHCDTGSQDGRRATGVIRSDQGTGAANDPGTGHRKSSDEPLPTQQPMTLRNAHHAAMRVHRRGKQRVDRIAIAIAVRCSFAASIAVLFRRCRQGRFGRLATQRSVGVDESRVDHSPLQVAHRSFRRQRDPHADSGDATSPNDQRRVFQHRARRHQNLRTRQRDHRTVTRIGLERVLERVLERGHRRFRRLHRHVAKQQD